MYSLLTVYLGERMLVNEVSFGVVVVVGEEGADLVTRPLKVLKSDVEVLTVFASENMNSLCINRKLAHVNAHGQARS